jgi:hypothetical protein
MSNVAYTTSNVGAFVPTQISGCQLWLDAQTTFAAFSNNQVISTWADRSANAFSGAAVASPTVVTNGINGQRAVQFNGTSQYVNFSNVINLGTNPLYIFALVDFDSTANGAIIGKTSFRGLAGRWFLNRDNVNSLGPAAGFDATGSGVVASFVGTSTEPQLFRGSWDRSEIRIFENGFLRATNTLVNSSNLSNTDPLWVGAYPNSTATAPQSGFFLNGKVGEILVYNSALTFPQQEQIEGYLAQRWGLSSSLPPGSLYTNPPTFTLTTTNQFNPTYLPSCQFWYDANDTSTMAFSNNNVTNWADKSGNGRNLSRFTTPGPFLTSNFNGSFRTVQAISASNGTIQVANIASSALQGSTGSTFFFVMNYDSGGVIAQYAEPRFISMQGSNRYDYGPLGSNVVYSLPTGFTFTNPQIFCQTVDVVGSNLRVYQTGAELSNAAITPITLAYTKPLAFFGIPGSGLVPGYGKLSEFLGYNRLLSTTERQQIEGYLAWKWGLQASLPASHPYVSQSIYFFSESIDQFTIPRSIRPAFFTPLLIPGSLLWFDAADTSTITPTTSGTVTAWVNKGTISTTATNRTGNCTTGNLFNGRNFIRCPAGTDLGFTCALNTQPRTWFAVARNLTQLNVTPVNYWGPINQTVGNGQDSLGFIQVSAGNYTGNIGPSGIDVTVTGRFTTNPLNVTNIYCFVNSSTSASDNRATLNGSILPLDRSVLAANFNTNSITYTINTSGYNTGADIFEIIFYNTALVDIEREKVEGYLAWKWGLQTTLPSTHPFRNFPPPPDPYQAPPAPPAPPFSGWSIVLDGADASVNNNGGGSYTCIGPNDGGGNGWAYIYALFSTAGSITYNYNWSTGDGITWDWPFEWVTSSDPSNPGNVNFNTKIASNNTESGSRTVSYGANQYVVLGVYSVDSVAGNGVCTFSGLPT